MSFDVPRGAVLPVDRIDVRLDPGPHPIEKGNAPAIRARWEQELASKPKLFDGEIVLLAALRYRDRVLEGRCHTVRYSTFLWWRSVDAGSAAGHCFAHAMPVGTDDALLAIRMGRHTVNAGKVYFAAGSFEPIDFRDGQVDAEFNMAREVGEETGLHLDPRLAEPGYHIWRGPHGTVIARRYRMDATATELAERVRAFVAGESDPEIEEPVVIASADRLPEGLAPQMHPLLEWHFANPMKKA